MPSTSEDFDRDAWKADTSNGQIPLERLAEVPDGGLDVDRNAPNVMEPHAAANMGALLAAARADGVTITIRYSYRTLDKQRDKWDAYQRGGNLAAKPGESNHGEALAVDFNSTDENVAWLVANAARFGFRNDVPSERWHWTYYGGGPAEVDDVALTEEQERTLAEAKLFLDELRATLGKVKDPTKKAATEATGARVARTVLRSEAAVKDEKDG